MIDNNARATRFLIDSIDKKLGSVEKEIKFDKIVIASGIVILVLFAVLTGVMIDRHPALSLIFLMIAMFGLFMSYVMIKELIDDTRRYKAEQKK